MPRGHDMATISKRDRKRPLFRAAPIQRTRMSSPRAAHGPRKLDQPRNPAPKSFAQVRRECAGMPPEQRVAEYPREFYKWCDFPEADRLAVIESDIARWEAAGAVSGLPKAELRDRVDAIRCSAAVDERALVWGAAGHFSACSVPGVKPVPERAWEKSTRFCPPLRAIVRHPGMAVRWLQFHAIRAIDWSVEFLMELRDRLHGLWFGSPGHEVLAHNPILTVPGGSRIAHNVPIADALSAFRRHILARRAADRRHFARLRAGFINPNDFDTGYEEFIAARYGGSHDERRAGRAE